MEAPQSYAESSEITKWFVASNVLTGDGCEYRDDSIFVANYYLTERWPTTDIYFVFDLGTDVLMENIQLKNVNNMNGNK